MNDRKSVHTRQRKAPLRGERGHPHARSARGGRDKARADHVDVGFGQVRKFLGDHGADERV